MNVILVGETRQTMCVHCIWNVMAHAQKPEFVFWQNGRVHLNGRGAHFSRLLAAKVCASAVVMLDIPWSEVMWRVLATHSIRQLPLHFPSCASPCAITFQLDSTWINPAWLSYTQKNTEINVIFVFIPGFLKWNDNCACQCDISCCLMRIFPFQYCLRYRVGLNSSMRNSSIFLLLLLSYSEQSLQCSWAFCCLLNYSLSDFIHWSR